MSVNGFIFDKLENSAFSVHKNNYIYKSIHDKKSSLNNCNLPKSYALKVQSNVNMIFQKCHTSATRRFIFNSVPQFQVGAKGLTNPP